MQKHVACYHAAWQHNNKPNAYRVQTRLEERGSSDSLRTAASVLSIQCLQDHSKAAGVRPAQQKTVIVFKLKLLSPLQDV
jgi:hypothetical protein